MNNLMRFFVIFVTSQQSTLFCSPLKANQSTVVAMPSSLTEKETLSLGQLYNAYIYILETHQGFHTAIYDKVSIQLA